MLKLYVTGDCERTLQNRDDWDDYSHSIVLAESADDAKSLSGDDYAVEVDMNIRGVLCTYIENDWIGTHWGS